MDGVLPARQARGRDQSLAQSEIRTRTTLIGAMLVRKGDADAMLCGTVGAYADHLRYVRTTIGLRKGVHTSPRCSC